MVAHSAPSFHRAERKRTPYFVYKLFRFEQALGKVRGAPIAFLFRGTYHPSQWASVGFAKPDSWLSGFSFPHAAAEPPC